MSRQNSNQFYLSPDQQDLLMAALTSNRSPSSATKSDPSHTAPASGHLDFSDDSPYLDFDGDGDFDESFDFDSNAQLIGDLPEGNGSNGLHDKRKSLDGQDEDDEGGGKRREGDDKTAKKPGRKPLTSEPTTKRKAQNRAAQRAFRERKEKHLKDLETKVEDLEKESEAANHENGMLRAQNERLQIEVREYRKRLSWISSNGFGRSQSMSSNIQPRSNSNQSDFQFEFPKFGDLPVNGLFGTNQSQVSDLQPNRSSTLPARPTQNQQNSQNSIRRSITGASPQTQSSRHASMSQSPINSVMSTSPLPQPQTRDFTGTVDSLSGLFSPSILEASRHGKFGYFPQQPAVQLRQNARGSLDNGMSPHIATLYANSSTSNTDSPGSSSESHQAVSSIGTSPEPSLSSPNTKLNDFGLNTINEENHMATFGGKDYLCAELQKACGSCQDPVPPVLNFSNDSSLGANYNTNNDSFGIDWLAQQNGGGFDPVLFGNYRETQDNILSQDFGTFFNDAYPLPDLGSPQHNYNEIHSSAPKVDLLAQVDAINNQEEVVPAEEKPMSCNKIWDRLQSMEKFRNGEIDIDNLCNELRAKAKCSEGGAVVDPKDVDKILKKAG